VIAPQRAEATRLGRVKRLLRVPVVLVLAALWALGSYALGFELLDNRFPVALGAAFAGGVVVTAALGGLISRPWPILLALPLAIGALTTSVYAAGIHHLNGLPRLTLVVAEQHCTHEHDTPASGRSCDHRTYAFRDPQGRPTTFHLAERDQRGPEAHPVGETVHVYRTTGDEIRWWPTTMLEPGAAVLTAARITAPAFAGYALLLGIAGALGQAATVRRFHRHMAG
jgi:hypothetical protein